MKVGSLEQLLIFGIVIGFLVTAGSFLYVDFANAYGFANVTDERFLALNQSQEFFDETQEARGIAQETDPILELIELIFQGGYYAIMSFISLPTTFDTMISNALAIFGLSAYRFYIYGIVSVIILFAVLNGLGVFKRNA